MNDDPEEHLPQREQTGATSGRMGDLVEEETAVDETHQLLGPREQKQKKKDLSPVQYTDWASI